MAIQAEQVKPQESRDKPASKPCNVCKASKQWWWDGAQYICTLCHATEKGEHDPQVVSSALKRRAYWQQRDARIKHRGKRKKDKQQHAELV